MSTSGAYHDECGDIMNTPGCLVHQGAIMSTLGDTKMHVGFIMGTPGVFSKLEGYPEYTEEIS